ncbi:hypothetical protein L210DRAFT_2874490 [Boletus edulis BED1]|uniref:Zn(2)-C6 fungal-type domain-containing protein n=1 Tax=Boletus edulis BED1 TaxID=1328754 RepID=A0AAD4BII0_BOLED|nr:hypothetical protein L210DRAFT_2874490 [Boletus edulis BED1]
MLSDDRMRHVRNPAFPLPLVVSDMPLDVDPRSALHGRLDPTTGIFYRAAEHPRIRTAQACNKCRVRKAKCSGERPICERCRIRGIGHAVHSKNDQRIQGMCLMHPSSTEVFNALRDLEPQKNHIVVHDAEHGTFEPTKDSITSEGGEGKGTLNEGDLPTFVVPRFLEGADASFITLADRDMAYAAPDQTDVTRT